MSWRRWNGWEPARATTYEHDDGGRLAAALITTEPEWDEESRGLAVALGEYEAGLCPSCRHPLAETTDPAHEERYVAGDAIRCHRCTASEQASRRYAESPSPGALLVPVDFHPPPRRDREEVDEAWLTAR